MQASSDSTKFVAGAVLVLLVGFAFWFLGAGPNVSRKDNIIEPALSMLASEGKPLFEAKCAACHGMKGAGTDKGPPLIHEIYNPGHHSDAAFLAAAKLGVRQHHWRFGNMPPQPQIDEQLLAAIVRYVREVQLANGIRFMPHHM